MHSTVRLAQTLATLTTDELERLLIERDIHGDVPHFTDLAIRLLAPESVTRALRQLTSSELDVLRHHESNERLRALGLTVADVPLPEVMEALAHLDTAHGMPNGSREARVPGERRVSADWAQRAFLEAQQAVLALRHARDHSLRVTRRGMVSQTSAKLLSEEIRTRQENIPLLVEALCAIDALVSDGSEFRVTQTGERWSVLPHPTRWVVLCAGMLGRMPHPLRESLRGGIEDLRYAHEHVLPRLFPFASAETRDQAQRCVSLAEHFAVTSNGVLTAPAIMLLTEGPSGASHAINAAAEAFPQTVAGVYVQPDLSVIAPGPLEPAVGLRLLDLADLTAPGLATSLTVSEHSLSRALDRGWTVPEIRAFLTRTSITPIPQPLEYLLRDLEERHGSIMVSASDTRNGITTVRAQDPRVTREMLADSRLHVLGLSESSEDPQQLHTRVALDHALSILTEARYPAARVTPNGSGQDSHAPGGCAPAESASDERASGVLAWIDRLLTAPDTESLPHARETAERLSAGETDAGGLDIVPVLELAARNGETLLVTVSDGKREHTFELQPISITQGRLRARDTRAQLERTLAIRAITAVEPFHNSAR